MVSGLLMSNIATDMLMSLRPKYSKLTLCTRMVLLELWARMKCYGNVSRFKTDGCKSIFVSWIVCSHAYRQCLKDGLQRANASWLIHLGLNAWEPSFLINRVHECVLVLWKGGVTSIVYMAGVKARKLFCPPVTEWQRSENRNRFLSSTFLRCRGGGWLAEIKMHRLKWALFGKKIKACMPLQKSKKAEPARAVFDGETYRLRYRNESR